MVYTDYAIVTNKMVNNLSCTVMLWVHTVAIIWKCFMNGPGSYFTGKLLQFFNHG